MDFEWHNARKNNSKIYYNRSIEYRAKDPISARCIYIYIHKAAHPIYNAPASNLPLLKSGRRCTSQRWIKYSNHTDFVCLRPMPRGGKTRFLNNTHLPHRRISGGSVSSNAARNAAWCKYDFENQRTQEWHECLIERAVIYYTARGRRCSKDICRICVALLNANCSYILYLRIWDVPSR